MKAVIACAHKILRIVYKLLKTHQTYEAAKALGMRQHPQDIFKYVHLKYNTDSVFCAFLLCYFQIKDYIGLFANNSKHTKLNEWTFPSLRRAFLGIGLVSFSSQFQTLQTMFRFSGFLSKILMNFEFMNAYFISFLAFMFLFLSFRGRIAYIYIFRRKNSWKILAVRI
ncbi:hypothetical protein JEQ21_09150 [Streptococcus sp. 121]|uniref:hypothetical protein n=1 Tax=Streptococcus sp. 121 TaxID=2797637 RepID=UPI0018F0C25E|nr:hypothetical protein [Streptococcus sp. 121]MBJ6746604.1 hypothetical protein [Streptococcus sp. 121]